MVERTDFGKLQPVIEPPDLIEIQTRSYREFLQMDSSPAKRKRTGLEAIFKEVLPIESYDGRYVLDYVKYELADRTMISTSRPTMFRYRMILSWENPSNRPFTNLETDP